MTVDAYAQLDDLRTFLRIDATQDADDPDSGLETIALQAARQAIDRACNRSFLVSGSTATDRYFTRLRQHHVPLGRFTEPFVEIDDLMDATDLVVALDAGDGTYTATTDYVLVPRNAAEHGKPWTGLRFTAGSIPTSEDGIKVTGRWGWSATPDAIVEANLLQASRLMKRRDAPFGVAGSPDSGSEIRLLSKLDPDVAVLIGPYKRIWAAAG